MGVSGTSSKMLPLFRLSFMCVTSLACNMRYAYNTFGEIMFYPQENSTSEYNYMHNKIIFHVQAAQYVFTGTTFIIQAL